MLLFFGPPAPQKEQQATAGADPNHALHQSGVHWYISFFY
jgi:hypothetical protein